MRVSIAVGSGEGVGGLGEGHGELGEGGGGFGLSH